MKKEFINYTEIPGNRLEIKNFKSKKPFFTLYTIINDNSILNNNTVNSVLNETYKEFEWLIFYYDKKKKELIDFLETNYPNEDRIKIIKIHENDNLLQYIKNNIKTQWVIYIDFDTYIDKTLLETFYCNILVHKTSVLYTNVLCINEKKEYSTSLVSLSRKIINLSSNTYCIEKNLIDKINFNKKIIKCSNISYTHLNFYGVWQKKVKSINIKIRNAEFINYPMSSLYNHNTEPKKIKFDLNQKNNDKTILCMVPWTKIGGADAFNIKVLKYLSDNDYDVILVSTEVCHYEARTRMEKVVSAYYDLTTFLDRTYWADFISSLIITKNVKLIFQLSSLYGYHIIPWLKHKYPKIPIIDYLHAEDFSWRNGGFPKDSTAISHLLDKTFTCNNHVAELMYEKMSRNTNNVETIYIGVDTEQYNPDIVKIEDRETEDFCKGKKVILFPSRFSYEKRPIFLLYVIAKITKKRDDIVCIMVGGGPAENDMKSYISKLKIEDKIKLVKMKNDIREYYKMANVTVVCSLSEGITLTTYESLSMNVPIVSADVGGQREVVIDKVGKIIKPYQNIATDLMNFNYSEEEINDYIEAILEIVDNKEKYCKKFKCREYVKTNFSQANLYKKIDENIKKLIKTGSKIKFDSNNEEYAIRYLVLFNETTKEFYNNNISYNNFKSNLKNRLWSHWWWRSTIKIAKKFKLDIIIKKIYFKEK